VLGTVVDIATRPVRAVVDTALGAARSLSSSLERYLPGWAGAWRVLGATEQAELVAHRTRDDAEAAIVLVHGFSWYPAKTWGSLPELLTGDPALDGWDVVSIGYNTGIAPDVRGVWAADPDIAGLATFLRSRLSVLPLDRYRSLALVGHSMGGLVVQRALVDDPVLAARTSHVLCFGTPSAGLTKARWARFLKSQIRDMGRDSPFLDDLRTRWDEQYGRERPFAFFAVAGDRDEFVPASSSLGPFPAETHVVVPGNHLEIVHVDSGGQLPVQTLRRALVGDAAPGGPWNAARVAVEQRDFQRAVSLLDPHADELDDRHVVELALALDATGRRERALAVLDAHAATGTDVLGVLAGRHKRSWLAEGRRDDAEAARDLYRRAYETATDQADAEQAIYHGINLAFLLLVYEGDRRGAAEVARAVLQHATDAKPDHWRRASEGDAHLLLGDADEALRAYRAVVDEHPSPRDVESVYRQASRLAAEVGRRDVTDELTRVFRPEASVAETV